MTRRNLVTPEGVSLRMGQTDHTDFEIPRNERQNHQRSGGESRVQKGWRGLGRITDDQEFLLVQYPRDHLVRRTKWVFPFREIGWRENLHHGNPFQRLEEDQRACLGPHPIERCVQDHLADVFDLQGMS